MIGLYKHDGTRLGITYRLLTLNDPTDTDPQDTYEVWAALVDAEHASVAEPKAQRDGIEIYRPRKQRRVIRITGAVKALTSGALFDKVEELSAAFDPVNAYDEDESTYDRGFLPLTFSRPTDDTANYPTGVKALQYYARPLAVPVTRVTKNDGRAARFAVLMECADPRAYAQSVSTASGTDDGAVSIDNTLASYPSWPQLDIELAGASGVVDFQMVADHFTTTLRLDFTGLIALDAIAVDMELKTVTVNGVDDMSLVQSSSDYWWIPPAEISTMNVTNVSGNAFDGTVDVVWRKAFA